MGYSKAVGTIDVPSWANGGKPTTRSDVFSTEDGKKFVVFDTVSDKAKALPDPHPTDAAGGPATAKA
jgi:hypothetical protein